MQEKHITRKQGTDRNSVRLNKTPRPSPSDSFPLTRIHFLIVSQSPQREPLAGDKLFTHMGLCGTFHIQITAHSLPSHVIGFVHTLLQLAMQAHTCISPSTKLYMCKSCIGFGNCDQQYINFNCCTPGPLLHAMDI